MLPHLPLGAVPRTTLLLDHRYHDDEGLAGAEYEATFADGSVRKGKLDGSGKATVDAVPIGVARVVFGPAAASYRSKGESRNPTYRPTQSAFDIDALVDRYGAALGKREAA